MSVKTIGIHGIGGAGKSWLAACVYRDWKSEKFWADVSQYPEFVVFAERILKSFDESISANFVQLGLTEQVNQLLAYLGKRRRLLVIDNLETLLDQSMQWRDPAYEQFFSRWREQGHTSVLLITTQNKPTSLREEPTWLNLTGLAPTEGGKLLKELGIQGPEEALQAFSIELDGHPLSLRLAATFLREYCNGLLDQAEKLKLTEFEQIATQAEGEHRSRLTRLEWILQQHLECLTDEQRIFLENLSVYRLPFDESAARVMLSPEAPSSLLETLKELRRLFNHSLLLQSEDNCYQLQPFIKKYVQHFADDLTVAHQRAVIHYQQISRFSPEIKDKDKVTADLEIFYHCCELAQFEEAYFAMDSRYQLLYQWGRYTTVVEVYKRLVEKWQAANRGNQNSIGWAYMRLGVAYHLLGESKAELEAYQQAQRIFTEITNSNPNNSFALIELTASLDDLGGIYSFLGQYSQSIKFRQQALEIIKTPHSQHIFIQNVFLQDKCHLLLNMGGTYREWEKDLTAVECYQEALEIAQLIGNSEQEVSALQELGLAYCALKEYPRAIKILRQSLKLARQQNDIQRITRSLSNLGFAYNSTGRHQRALKFHEYCLKMMQQSNNRREEAGALKNIAEVYNCLGKHLQAIELQQQALDIVKETGDRQSEAIFLNYLGKSHSYLGEHEQARECYQNALKIAQQIGYRRGEADFLFSLGASLENLNRKPEAGEAYQQARELYISWN
jgi:tetratricopeptide (TPR) repeat protein